MNALSLLSPPQKDKTMTLHHAYDVVRFFYPPETSPLPPKLQRLMEQLKAAEKPAGE